MFVIPADELTWRFGPSGGPGGQHANTANTRAEVVFEIEASPSLSDYHRTKLFDAFGPRLRVVADDTRSQSRNREIALKRLETKVADALKPKTKRRATKPSRGSKERRLKSKKRTTQLKAQRRTPNQHD
jgi:ribosome-associated protein